MEKDFKIIKSTRRKPILLHHGYSFSQDKENYDIIRWRCSIRKCKGFLLIQKKIMIIVQKNIIIIKMKCKPKRLKLCLN
jgi:hypothetical protein